MYNAASHADGSRPTKFAVGQCKKNYPTHHRTGRGRAAAMMMVERVLGRPGSA